MARNIYLRLTILRLATEGLSQWTPQLRLRLQIKPTGRTRFYRSFTYVDIAYFFMMTIFSFFQYFQYLNTETSLIFCFASVVDFTESPPKATMRPPLRLVIKTEDSSGYGNEYATSLPLTPDSTREILSVISRCWVTFHRPLQRSLSVTFKAFLLFAKVKDMAVKLNCSKDNAVATERRNIMDMNFDIIPGHWHSCLGRLTTGVLTAVTGWPKVVSTLVQTFAFTS